MKKLLAVLSVAALFSPTLTFAAATDVSMDTTVVLNIGGIEVDISGDTAVVESITVGDSTFSFNLVSGSSIQVTAPNRNILTANTPQDRDANVCTSSQSLIKYTGTSAHTITITPSASLCSSASSSGGGGGGGGSATPATPAVPTVLPAVPATPFSSGLTSEQVTAILNVLASFNADASTIASVKAALEGSTITTGSVTSTAVGVFKANLTTGSLGSEVKALQMFLNAHGYTVASSGPGSSGNETTTFGGLTRAALVKYQKAKGITPAVGYFGPLTRAYINSEQ